MVNSSGRIKTFPENSFLTTVSWQQFPDNAPFRFFFPKFMKKMEPDKNTGNQETGGLKNKTRNLNSGIWNMNLEPGSHLVFSLRLFTMQLSHSRFQIKISTLHPPSSFSPPSLQTPPPAPIPSTHSTCTMSILSWHPPFSCSETYPFLPEYPLGP